VGRRQQRRKGRRFSQKRAGFAYQTGAVKARLSELVERIMQRFDGQQAPAP
jgi:hypothetical protein